MGLRKMEHLKELREKLERASEALEQVREILEDYNFNNPTGGPMSLRHLELLEDDLDYLYGSYTAYIEDLVGR